MHLRNLLLRAWLPCLTVVAVALMLAPRVLAAEAADSQCELGIDDAQFTINNRPTFLLGISYYGGLGAPKEQRGQDFDEMQKCGFNWVRVWATWAAFGGDLAAVDPTSGEPREPYFTTLIELIAECDRRSMVVDVTLSRGKSTAGPPRLPTHAAHRRAVQVLVEKLRPYRNWYLDLANERNIGDSRHASIGELHDLRELVRRLDARRLVTA
ncbi:MAG TPA: hypothetical protein VFW87_10120, partial [Pirellulales bacterium]|nr:hypothetical protein [Pirellulales bacterium]